MWNILWVDRWTKYIGLAYQNEKTNMIMPIWYIMNDQQLFFNIADIVSRYFIKQAVVWYPKQHEDNQQKIDEFLENLVFIDPNIEIIKTNEEYTSVEAGETTENFKKNEAEDTIAAMHILKYYLKNKEKNL